MRSVFVTGSDRRRRLRRVISRRDERGSLVVALSVIMVLVLLSSLIFVRVIGEDQLVSARQNTYAGVSGANAGLSDALFQLDQGNTGSGTICLNAVNSSDPNCTIHVTASNPQLTGVSYVAKEVSSGPLTGQQWTVQAIGNAQTGMKGAVQETLTRTSLFPFALFGKTSLTFTGNATNNFGTYTPGDYGDSNFTICPNSVTNPPCLLIGSDGSVNCTPNGSPLSVTGVYFNTGSGGGSDSCGTPQSQNTTYNVPDPTAPTPPAGSPAYTCPNGGQLGAGNGYATIPPGTYVCTSPISISGNLAVDSSTTDSNPVKIYVILGGSGAANTTSTTFAMIAMDSQINTDIPYSSGANPSGYSLPDPQLFQLYTNSVGVLDVNGAHGFVYGGILDAPEASLTTNGCKSYFYGAAIINTYTCHGGPNLGIFYDTQLSQDYGPWQVSGYQQVNPASVLANIP